jgi:hypothetical protein
MSGFDKNKAKIDIILGELESLREEANEILTEMLKEATLEVAAQYPGHCVSTVSAMGSWTITVKDVVFDGDPLGFGQNIRNIDLVSADPEQDEEECPTLAVLDNVWDQLQTYPTVRFDVDKDGVMTMATDWGTKDATASQSSS